MGIGTRDGSQSDFYPRTCDQARIWFPARNVGAEVIPGYSIVQLLSEYGTTAPGDFPNESIEGQVAWRIGQCNDEGFTSGNPGRFAIVGPDAIGVGGQNAFGRVSWSSPIQVLHDYKNDILRNGQLCGPIPGSWGVHSRGRGWIWIGHDATEAFGNHKYHTGWVMPMKTMIQSFGRWNQSSSSSPTDANNPVHLNFAAADETLGGGLLYNSYNAPNFVSSSAATGAQITVAGIYDANLSATIWSSNLDAYGTALSLSISVYRAADGSKTVWYRALRYHDVERDYENSVKTAQPENVATGGYLCLEKDDIVEVLNTSGIAISIAACQLSLVRIQDSLKLDLSTYSLT